MKTLTLIAGKMDGGYLAKTGEDGGYLAETEGERLGVVREE